MSLSLRSRLSLAICSLLTIAVFASAATFIFFSRDQLLDERENCLVLAKQFAATLNHVIANSAEPQNTLREFVSNMDRLSPGMVAYVPVDTPMAMDMTPQVVKGVPAWFTHWIAAISPGADDQFPILLNGKRIGDFVVMPDPSADIHEKWLTFLGIVTSALVLALLSSVIVYFTVGISFAPINQLSEGLASLRAGNYETLVHPSGPPEFHVGLQSLNDLASTLRELRDQNRALLRRIVSIQDEERNELSRELHDEIGPLLFSVRANAGAIKDGLSELQNPEPFSRLMEAAQSLQQVHRNILERLRPLHLKELGLVESIKSLFRDTDLLANITHTLTIDPAIEAADDTTRRTIYRVVQEALTNVMRHSRATHVDVAIKSIKGHISIIFSDNGVGFAKPRQRGRGLTGMRERLRALDGTLEIEREQSRTVLRALLPTSTLAP